MSLGLRHRYSFSGSGVKVVDSMGTASGTVVNTQLNGSGKLTLAAATLAQYVDLPNGIISQLGDATVEVWFTVSAAGGVWERVFDFGSSDAGEGNQGLGATYLFFSPKSNNSQIHGIIHTSSTNGELLVSDALTAVDKTVVVALVVDDSHDTLTLYKDGTFRSAVAFLGHLSEIQDVNNWLGRSQFKDPVFRGTIDELRIYGSALSASAIAKSFGAGPDATINP